MKGYMYILLCNDGSYYTGSTNDLERRMAEHFSGQGANHTKKHPPVKLLYYEEFQRIDEAFYKEKQVQGWSRKKKEALINGQYDKLPELSRCYSQKEAVASSSSATSPVVDLVETTDANPATEKYSATASDKKSYMECRPGCAACCTVISISSPIPGMPNGKPAGVRCVNLDDDLRCKIFGRPERPRICGAFQPDPLICGQSRAEAVRIMADLEGIDAEQFFEK